MTNARIAIAGTMVALAGVSAGTWGAVWGDEPPSKSQLPQLAWITGHWMSQGKNATVEEIWTDGRGGVMFGLSRTISGDKLKEWEFLRIVEDSHGVSYLASPNGRSPATPFRATEVTENRVVFANPAHDFPQQIEYRLEGGKLQATISGPGSGDKPKSMSWTYERVVPKSDN